MAVAAQTAPERQAPARKRVMDLLARALWKELSDAWDGVEPKPEFEFLKGPETGLVMVRGRVGGGGAPFNLGEATMTRATVRLSNGMVGQAFALGTDREKARLAAIFDALAQQPEHMDFVEQRLLAPIVRRLATEDKKKAEETAATRVDFFTMVRGED